MDLNLSLYSVHDVTLHLSYIAMWVNDVDLNLSLYSIHDVTLHLSYICGYMMCTLTCRYIVYMM